MTITCKPPRRILLIRSGGELRNSRYLTDTISRLVVNCRPYDYVGRYGRVVTNISHRKKLNGSSYCEINWFGTDEGGKLLKEPVTRLKRNRRIPTPKNIGFGSAAYQQVEKWLKSKLDCDHVELSPADDNAERFWKRQGYICSEKHGYSCGRMKKSFR